MTVADKLAMILAPVADDVARAVAEFGDDTVREVMKLNPAMRKRLASLAERRIEKALETKTIPRRRLPGKELSFPQPKAASKRERVNAASEYLLRNIAPKNKQEWSGYDIQNPEIRTWIDSIRQSPEATMSYFHNLRFQPASEVEKIADIQKRISSLGESVAATADRPEVQASYARGLDKEQKRLERLVLGITEEGKVPADIEEEIRFAARAKRLGDLYYGIPRSERTEDAFINLPALTRQLDLAALLRMAGDAQ